MLTRSLSFSTSSFGVQMHKMEHMHPIYCTSQVGELTSLFYN
jgi:hypothetical protein